MKHFFQRLRFLYLVLGLLLLHSCSLCYAEKTYTITESQFQELNQIMTDLKTSQKDLNEQNERLKMQIQDLNKSSEKSKRQVLKTEIKIGAVSFGCGCLVTGGAILVYKIIH